MSIGNRERPKARTTKTTNKMELINKIQTNPAGYHMMIANGVTVCAPNIEILLTRAAKKREEIKMKRSL